MKKLFLFIALFGLGISLSAQSLFKPVPTDLFAQAKHTLQAAPVNSVWLWRFDATVSINEAIWDFANKQIISNTFSAVGPGIGIKHFIPKSATDPTPFENYGFSAAVLLGTNIYQPDFTKIKVALEADLFQYIKGGLTFTAGTKNWLGAFIGTGISF
jgi:hypothetical protein